ncbi:MAG TPA: D-aminoacyl-tRNA deacylase [Candidatus Nanoarchaeia archaeon]|nr:D-aminoacyl-tRNA deacylase [Candidatus Nanoarchaeia archaeon]
MYKKFLIVASKLDKAGINITSQLSQFKKNPLASVLQQSEKGFDFYLVEKEIIFTENLNHEKINNYDFIIFASKHRSEKGEKAITIHTPGNPKEAKFGGEAGKICRTSAIFQKQLFDKLNKNAEKYELREYDITLEATHHGPLIDKPCIFVEIGSTDTEYNDRRAGFVVAKTISEAIEEFKESPYNEVAVAVGGPHYCPNFNKIQLMSNIAISHVIPAYSLPLTDELITEAIRKTEEEVDFVVVDWKGLGKAEERNEIVKILERNYLQWKKTSEINR